MNLADYAKVQQLVEERAKVAGKLSVLNLSGHKLTSHFNVHFSGTAQPAEIAEIAAGALRTFFRDQLTSIDVQLTGLGVKVDAPAATPDPLASLRPERLLAQPHPDNLDPDVFNALLLLIKTAINEGGVGRFWNVGKFTVEQEGKTIPLGDYRVTVQRTG